MFDYLKKMSKSELEAELLEASYYSAEETVAHLAPLVKNKDALKAACYKGHLGIVKMLLAQNYSRVDMTDSCLSAIYQNHHQIIDFMVESQKLDASPLIQEACKKDSLMLLRKLFEHQEADIHENFDEHFKRAFEWNAKEVINYLLVEKRIYNEEIKEFLSGKSPELLVIIGSLEEQDLMRSALGAGSVRPTVKI